MKSKTSLDIPNTFYRTSIKALILDDQNRFLLAKEDNGFWELLGGGLDFGEDPKTCLTREIQEETGLIVTSVSQNPSYFVTFLNQKNIWFSNVIYKVKVKNLDFIPSSECVELKFFTKEEALEINAFPSVKKLASIFDPKNL